MPFKFLIATVAVVLLLATVFFRFAKPSTTDYQLQAKLIAKECITEKDKQKCYNRFFTKIASKEDFEFSGKVLKALQLLDPDARQCHGLAHAISVSAVHKNPPSWMDLIHQANTADCAGGYLHGIIEGHITSDPSFIVDAKSILEVCSNQSGVSTSACAHGFGHVLLFQTEGDIYKATLICANTGPLVSQCYNGVFMEDAFQDLLFEHGFVKEKKNPTKDTGRFAEVKNICHEFKNNPNASSACWANLGHIFADFYKHDGKKIYAACNEGPTEKEKRICYFRGISSLVILPDFSESNKTLALCSSYQEQDLVAYGKCVEYIATTLVYHSDGFIERAVNICLNADSMAKEGCFKLIGATLSTRMNSKEKQTACDIVPANYREWCLSANSEQRLFQMF